VFTRVRPDPLAGQRWIDAGLVGVVTKPRRAHVVDLSVGEEALLAGFHKNTRRALRKAEKSGLDVELDTTGRLLPTYYDLYEKSLTRWAEQSHEPVWLARWRGRRRDRLAKLQTMARCLGDRFRLWMAFKDGAAAAGSIVLIGNAAHDTRGAMDRELAGPTRANVLLSWLSMLDALAEGCTTYHLGETGSAESLARYKENIGGRSYSYADYRIERLPVTRADAALRGVVKAVVGFREG
jgi:lipid II:glycine glycyltransferase (peptidoglycan interpeptide bridge formation enzyme)